MWEARHAGDSFWKSPIGKRRSRPGPRLATVSVITAFIHPTGTIEH